MSIPNPLYVSGGDARPVFFSQANDPAVRDNNQLRRGLTRKFRSPL